MILRPARIFVAWLLEAVEDEGVGAVHGCGVEVDAFYIESDAFAHLGNKPPTVVGVWHGYHLPPVPFRGKDAVS